MSDPGRFDGGYDDVRFYEAEDESWSGASRRRRSAVLVLVAFAVVLTMVGAGAVIVLFGGDGGQPTPVAATSAAPTTPAPSPVLTEAPPPTTAAPTPSATPSRRKVAPSRNPAATAVAEPPIPAGARPTKPGCVEKTAGAQAAYPAVRAALKTASARTYWKSAPSIQVPERLLHAVAFTESTWRSNVTACDGGLGLMQVMPDTVTMLNNRFGTTWKVDTLQGNAYLGGQYIAWSTRYLGDRYFGGSYDLTNEALLTSVISAYNYGVGAVDPTKGEAGIENWGYVNRVKQYLQSCPCDAW